MYLYFDKKGILKEIINDLPVRQGSDNANTIYAHFEDITDVEEPFITFLYPDQTKSSEYAFDRSLTQEVPYEKERDLQFFKYFTPYKFFAFSLRDTILNKATDNGVYKATIRLFNGSHHINTAGQVLFNVEGSIQADSIITKNEYNDLLNAVSNKVSKNSELYVQKYDTLSDANANISNLVENSIAIIPERTDDTYTIYVLQKNSFELLKTVRDKDIDAIILKLKDDENINTTQTKDINDLRLDITKIESEITKNETPITSYSGDTLPSDSELNAVVLNIMNRTPENGDVIFFTLTQIGTDDNYKYFFTASGWKHYLIPCIEKSQNGTAGIISGTYGIGDTNEILFDIVDSKIRNFYFKSIKGYYVNGVSSLQDMESDIKGIENGSIIVGKSKATVKDQLGNTINSHYLSQKSGATKDFVREYAQPKAVFNTQYILKDSLVDTKPTTSSFENEIAINSVGEFNIINAHKTAISDFTINDKTNISLNLWFSLSAKNNIKVKTTFLYKKAKDTDYNIGGVFLSGVKTLNVDEITRFDVALILDNLSSDVNIEIGDEYKIKVDIITENSNSIKVRFWSNDVYSSTLNFLVSSIAINVNYVGAPAIINVLDSDFVKQNDLYIATLSQDKHKQYDLTKTIVEGLISNGGNYDKVNIDYSINGTDLIIKSTTATDYILKLYSATSVSEKVIKELINPQTLGLINYDLIGTIAIRQTVASTPLQLETPSNVARDYRVYISNKNNSTNEIEVNSVRISVGEVLCFKWNGAEWQLNETELQTSDVYDDLHNKTLNATLTDYDNKIAKQSAILNNGKAEVRTIAFCGYRASFDLPTNCMFTIVNDESTTSGFISLFGKTIQGNMPFIAHGMFWKDVVIAGVVEFGDGTKEMISSGVGTVSTDASDIELFISYVSSEEGIWEEKNITI